MPPEAADDAIGRYGFPATVHFSRGGRGPQPILSFCARIVASVVPPVVVTRLSAMRWMPRPNSWAFLAVRVRVLTPIQAISDDSRPYSIFGQRFITTFKPFASASFAASSLR